MLIAGGGGGGGVVSLSRGNILPLMVNQYFTEGISVIRGTQVQKVRLYVCGSNPSRFFP